jgi:hypothetical protein
MKRFFIVLKELRGKKETGAQNKTVREMSQLMETIFEDAGRRGLLKGIYKPVERGCVERA